ncbi:MAG: hypothetical protein LUC18_05340 [Porphyromonadaceae bacterium]|nr:hypothetical protein [Porphyromonadaceae bacterium]MCD8288248.1 hypothetical protein [Porphyromonadaceae bacterium]
MISDDRKRIWDFSRGERKAVIILLIAIVVLLAVRLYVRNNPPAVNDLDETWIKEEIPAFESQFSR